MSDLCVRCDANPPLVTGMSLCRQCLKAKVEADRAERAARWTRQRQTVDALRDWQKPLWEGKP